MIVKKTGFYHLNKSTGKSEKIGEEGDTIIVAGKTAEYRIWIINGQPVIYKTCFKFDTGDTDLILMTHNKPNKITI